MAARMLRRMACPAFGKLWTNRIDRRSRTLRSSANHQRGCWESREGFRQSKLSRRCDGRDRQSIIEKATHVPSRSRPSGGAWKAWGAARARSVVSNRLRAKSRRRQLSTKPARTRTWSFQAVAGWPAPGSGCLPSHAGYPPRDRW